MNTNRNINNRLEIPDFILCKASRERVGIISCTEKKYTKNFNDLDEITFTTYLYTDISDEYALNPVYELIDIMKYVEVPDYGYFYIDTVNLESEGTRQEYKSVTCKSIEGLIAQKYLELFSINMEVDEEDWEKYNTRALNVSFYNALDQRRSLLHLALKEKCPQWNFGHIDAGLIGLERSFEIDRQDIYSFLMNDVAEAFRCFFIFDTLTMTVNAYETKNYGIDTNIYVSYENLEKHTNISCDLSNIKTCLSVTGADDMNLREINIGMMELYNFDYYNSTEFMSEGLYNAFNTWKAKYDTLTPQYKDLLVQRANLSAQNINLRVLYPEITDQPEEWYLKYELTEDKIRQMLLNYGYDPSAEYSGSSPLGEIRAAYEQLKTAYQTGGQSVSGGQILSVPSGGVDIVCPDPYDSSKTMTVHSAPSVQSETYTTNTNYQRIIMILNCVNDRINSVTNQLLSLENSIQGIDDQLAVIAENASIDNNFTPEQWKELSLFIREDELSSENFLVFADDTEEERLEMENALYAFAEEELMQKAQPQLSFSCDLQNIYEIPEFDGLSEYFDVGNYIWVSLRDDYVVRAKITSISMNFLDSADFSVSFGNIVRKEKTIYTDIQDAVNTANSAATTLSFGSGSWYAGKNQSDKISNILSQGLLDASSYLKGTTDTSEMTIDPRGIFVNQTSGTHPNDGIYVGNGRIYFTDDNWNTVQTALGRIDIEGESVFGLLTKYIVAGAVYGSDLKGNNIIGGVIVSENYQMGQKGTYIDLINGRFEFNHGTGKAITLDQNGFQIYGYATDDELSGAISAEVTNRNNAISTSIAQNNLNYYSKANIDNYFSNYTTTRALATWLAGSDRTTLTTINGGLITTGFITSANKRSWIDLDKGAFNFGGGTAAGQSSPTSQNYIAWSPDVDNGVLKIKGNIYANNGTFNGTITANDGKIGSLNINSSGLTYGGMSLTSSGLTNGTNYNLGSNGTFSLGDGAIEWDGTNGRIRSKNGYSVIDFVDGSFSFANGGLSYSGGALKLQTTGTDDDGYTAFSKIQDGRFFGNYIYLGKEYQYPQIFFDTQQHSIDDTYNKYVDRSTSSVLGIYSDGRFFMTKGLTVVGGATFGGRVNTNLLTPNETSINNDNPGYNLGNSNFRWNTVYARNTTISSSDLNLKHNISEIEEKYESLFFDLKPVSYMFNNGDRVHIGIISQELEKSMTKNKMSNMDFAAFCKDIRTETKENGEEEIVFDDDGNIVYDYAVRYSEFIMLNTHMLQKAYKRIESLENEIKELKETIKG